MDNMELNNIKENTQAENSMRQDNAEPEADYQVPEPDKKEPETAVYAPEIRTNEEQKIGCINIHNIPVKKHRFRKVLPFIASTLIAAIMGGAAGGAYVNYRLSSIYSYPSNPLSSSLSQGQVKPTSNTSSSYSLISKIAEAVGPSVIGINTTVVSQNGTNMVEGSGSGVIFDSKGYIITNQHVIDGSKEIWVTLPGRDPIKATVVGADTMSDIAVIKINMNNLPAARLGDSSAIRVGDLAVAIGNPMGDQYAGSVTSGIISAVNRKMYTNDGQYSRRYHLIQTDAAINPGNSGGALINENGEVIGINTIKYVGENIEGMGFAIPINEVKDIVDQLMTNGYVSRPMLGIGAGTIDEATAKEYNCPIGADVMSVQPGGAAATAGLKVKDIIVEIDGVKIKSSDDLISELEKHKVGDSIKLKIWRDNAYITVPVNLTDSKQFTS